MTPQNLKAQDEAGNVARVIASTVGVSERDGYATLASRFDNVFGVGRCAAVSR